MMDTFNEWSVIDLTEDHEEDKKARRKHLVNEDSARRPWLLGPAIRSFHYGLPQRIWVVARETLDAALWSWRMSK